MALKDYKYKLKNTRAVIGGQEFDNPEFRVLTVVYIVEEMTADVHLFINDNISKTITLSVTGDEILSAEVIDASLAVFFNDLEVIENKRIKPKGKGK